MDRNDRQVAAFTMLAHPMFHAYELVIPIFIVIWLDVFPVTPATLGLVVGGSYALTGLGALPSGILADRVSSKRLIVYCLAGMGGSFLLVAVAPNVYVLSAALLAWGASASIYHPAGLALISRSAKERGTVFAYHGAAGNVGVATGPLLAAVLLVFFEWRTVAALLGLPVLLALLVATRLEFDEAAGSVARGAELANGGTGDSRPNGGTGDDSRPNGGTDRADERATDGIRSVRAFLANSRLLFTGGFVVVFVMGILYGLFYRGAFTFLPEILADLPLFEPVAWLGREFLPSQYVYSGLLLLGGIGQYAGGKLVDRVHVEYALVGGYLSLTVVTLAFLPAAEAGLVPLVIVAGVLGLLAFMIAPINQEAISEYSAANVRGLSFGYQYTAILGVGAFGATLAGFVLTHANAVVLFAVLTAIVVAAATLGLYLIHRAGHASIRLA